MHQDSQPDRVLFPQPTYPLGQERNTAGSVSGVELFEFGVVREGRW